jgi:hypothetical protein
MCPPQQHYGSGWCVVWKPSAKSVSTGTPRGCLVRGTISVLSDIHTYLVYAVEFHIHSVVALTQRSSLSLLCVCVSGLSGTGGTRYEFRYKKESLGKKGWINDRTRGTRTTMRELPTYTDYTFQVRAQNDVVSKASHESHVASAHHQCVLLYAHALHDYTYAHMLRLMLCRGGDHGQQNLPSLLPAIHSQPRPSLDRSSRGVAVQEQGCRRGHWRWRHRGRCGGQSLGTAVVYTNLAPRRIAY